MKNYSKFNLKLAIEHLIKHRGPLLLQWDFQIIIIIASVPVETMGDLKDKFTQKPFTGHMLMKQQNSGFIV